MTRTAEQSRAAKKEILSRIRSAQKSAGLADHVDVPRDYQRDRQVAPDELRDLLVDRLVDYKADVHVTDAAELPATLAKILADKDCHDIRYAPGMDTALFAEFDGEAKPDSNDVDPRTLNEVDAVVTESHVTAAQTGTISLEAGETNGRRALTLVPDRHVCIVRQENIVYGVPEMVSRMNPEHPATWISGPSATSDIELSRVEGVHGPRDLIVVIVK
ncbi:LUD domain-containing protein [Corynebacterium sp. LK2537]|uniref:lactate utilization protein C n=1 Tax=Corynebacterium sp. LK2537 TaxID=3110471 RepID=UPI0034CE32D7